MKKITTAVAIFIWPLIIFWSGPSIIRLGSGGQTTTQASSVAFSSVTGVPVVNRIIVSDGSVLNSSSGLIFNLASGALGLATGTPTAGLSVHGTSTILGGALYTESTTTTGGLIATSTLGIGTTSPVLNNQLTVDGMALMAGHIETQGKPPVVSSCGTSPSVIGSDTAGVMTAGTTPGTACILTFANPYRVAPVCVISDESTAVVVRPTVTATTLTINGVLTSGDLVSYICMGMR